MGRQSSCHWREPVGQITRRCFPSPGGAALFIGAKACRPLPGASERIAEAALPQLGAGGKQSVTPIGVGEEPPNCGCNRRGPLWRGQAKARPYKGRQRLIPPVWRRGGGPRARF